MPTSLYKKRIGFYEQEVNAASNPEASLMIIQRIPTGIPKFDELIEGGFPNNSMILLVGYPGAGKTTFSAQFLYNGATRHSARGVYVCFAETKETFLRNMLRFGWDFERLEKEGRIAILDLSVTREAGLQKNLDTIMETMTSIDASRLVIDSFSAISMGLKEPIDIRVMIHLLYRFLKKANCVSILILDQPWGSSALGEGISEFLADGIIHLETYFDENEVFRRRLRILKMRGTNHSKRPHEYDITSDGFVIMDTKPSRIRKREIERLVGMRRTSSRLRMPIELSEIKGIGVKRAERLMAMGITSAEDLAEVDPEFLASNLRISERMAYKWIEAARKLVSRR